MTVSSVSLNKQIVISNQINEARFKMSKGEQKLFLYCIGIVDNDKDSINTVFDMGVKDFAEFLGLNNNHINRDMIAITKDMATKIIEIVEEDRLRQIPILSLVDYHKGRVKIKINQELIPFLVGLKASFTKYSLQEVLNFKSLYSMRIYQLLCQFDYKGEVIYTLEKLKFLLNIDLHEYQRYNDFKKDVLEKALKEINRSSTLKFIYKELKTGKKITSIHFIVKKHTKPKIESVKTDIKNTSEYQELEKLFTPKKSKLPVPNFIISQNQSKEITEEEFIKFVTSSNPKLNKIDGVPVVTLDPTPSLSVQHLEISEKLQKLGFNQLKALENIETHGLDYLFYVFDKSKIETREKIENKAGYFQSVVNTYKETYKAQNEALEAQKAQSKLNIELETDRKSKIKQKEREFEQEQEVLSREILENDPEIFCKAVYGYMQTFIVDMQFGFTSHPDYNQNRVNNLQSENLKIAKEIRSRFLACQSLRDFINLIKYDEEWLFKAVFYSPEQFDKKNPSYYKSKISLAKLERVELPFNI